MVKTLCCLGQWKYVEISDQLQKMMGEYVVGVGNRTCITGVRLIELPVMDAKPIYVGHFYAISIIISG